MQVGLGFCACHVTFWFTGRLRKSLLSHVCTEAYLACAIVKLLARYVLPCAVFVFVVVCFCCYFERLAQPDKTRAAMESHEAMPLQELDYGSGGLGFRVWGFKVHPSRRGRKLSVTNISKKS